MGLLDTQQIKSLILDVPDFPKKGIIFKDITPIFEMPKAFSSLINELSFLIPKEITKLVAIESRGFILASGLSQKTNLPFCLVRKKGKLPRKTIKVSYDLEYGTDELYIHDSSIKSYDHVLIVDDVLATGGTAAAVEALCTNLNVSSTQSLFLLELAFLNGADKLKYNYKSLIQF
jgi:adenine phosphoribosyltransferase